MAEVWIDSREHNIISLFGDDYKTTVKTLQAGDYALIYRGKILALVERKTWKDLAATIIDPKRRKNYLKMLNVQKTEKYCEDVYYLIEGRQFVNPNSRIGRVPFKSLEAHLDHLLRDHGISTIYSPDKHSTPDRLFRLLKNICSSHSKPLEQIDNEINVDVVGGDDETRNRDVEKKLTQRVVKTPDIIHETMLCKLKSVTNVIATALFKHGVRISDIISGNIRYSDISDIRLQNGKQITKHRFTSLTNSILSVKVQVNILESIPLISKETATHIIDQFTLQELQKLTSDELADLKTPNRKTRIGVKAGDNIYQYIN